MARAIVTHRPPSIPLRTFRKSPAPRTSPYHRDRLGVGRPVAHLDPRRRRRAHARPEARRDHAAHPRAAVAPALGGAALLVFVDCLKELPATLLLRPLNVETLSTYIYQYATRGNFEDGALAALLIVAAGIVPVIRMARYSDLALMPEAAPQ